MFSQWLGSRSFLNTLWSLFNYFIAIGFGFKVAGMAFMQQLSIFLGHPVYSFAVALGELILSTGVGSLVSDR